MKFVKFSTCLLLLVLVTIPWTICQFIVGKPCPYPEKRPVIQNFDLDRYVDGKWYEILRYEQHFEIGCDCNFATYTKTPKNGIKVKNCCKRSRHAQTSCVEGSAYVSYPKAGPVEGKLNVTFSGPPDNSNYWILATDYENYSIVYSCKNISDEKSAEAAWLLSKQRTLNPIISDEANNLINNYFQRDEMRITRQDSNLCDHNQNHFHLN
uniref:Apolipoprotein D n=1 Tax=Corethrella appendiculata TaxID=1370023 RepID=U5ER28_9DIPT